MLKPSISVLIPVYNADKYIREAIESILTQTFSNFELIIINDGSTDNSESILQEYQSQDQRIKLISRRNKGLIVSLNEGLSYAQGQYIARMDGDDVALPERFAKQVTFLDNNADYVAVGSRVLLIDPEGLPIRPFSESTTHEAIDAANLTTLGSAICHPTVMIRRDTLLKIDGYREKIKSAEDIDLFLRLAEVGRLANLPETLLKYRLHPKSIGHARRIEQKQFCYVAIKDACLRRGLESPTILGPGDQRQASLDEIHCKWAWWALGAGNVATARKHALLALSKNPISAANWKLLACAVRGW